MDKKKSRMKRIITFLIIISCFWGCKENPKKTNIENIEKHQCKTMSNERYYVLIDSALEKGSYGAYNEASHYSLIENWGQDFMLYAFIMANKHKDPEAYYHVYLIIVWSSSKQPKEALESFDNKTRNFALYYLLKSYEMGYENAKSEINIIFGENAVIPKSYYYLKEFAKE
jgi:hypothetical protein